LARNLRRKTAANLFSPGTREQAAVIRGKSIGTANRAKRLFKYLTDENNSWIVNFIKAENKLPIFPEPHKIILIMIFTKNVAG
jgi:hypothetical protein